VPNDTTINQILIDFEFARKKFLLIALC
ncbi:MAG: hypothetical protein FD167_5720, partial [bacterium]